MTTPSTPPTAGPRPGPVDPSPPSPPPVPPPEATYPGSAPGSPQRLAARCLPGILAGRPPYLVVDERWHYPRLSAAGRATLEPDRKELVYARVNYLLGRHAEEWSRQDHGGLVGPVPDLTRQRSRQVARLALPAASLALPGRMLASYAEVWRAYLRALEALPPDRRRALAAAAGLVVEPPAPGPVARRPRPAAPWRSTP